MATAKSEELDKPCPEDVESNLHSRIGSLFAQARTEKNISIQDAADSIYIRKLYLEAIEQGRFDVLPGTVYTVGFIKSYARFLNLDGNEIIRQLDLFPDVEENSPLNQTIVLPEEQGKPSRSILFSSIFLIIAFIGGRYLWIHHSQEKTQDPIATEFEAEHPASETPILAAETPQTVPQTSTESPPSPSSEPVPVKTEEKKEMPAAASPVDESIKLKAEEASWVEVRDQAGKVLFMKILPAGETYDIPSQPGLILNTGNAGGLSLSVGGKKTKLLGKHGQVLRGVSLDPENLKKMIEGKE